MANNLENNKNIGSEQLRGIISSANIVDSFFEYCKLNNSNMVSVRKHTKSLLYSKNNKGEFCCIPNINENGILTDYTLITPKPTDVMSSLMNIHGTIHALCLEKNLGKEFQQDEFYEVLPVLYEAIFINFLDIRGYNVRKTHKEYMTYQKESIKKTMNDDSKSKAYFNAYNIQECLVQEFILNPNQTIDELAAVINGDISIESYLKLDEQNKNK